ncbi:hypothetical protein [Ehrlichia muris]|uniref:hypothetical protein n=1 Tax=Ehrlichia muris TaxID=35795 RepID=UPI0037BE73FD
MSSKNILWFKLHSHDVLVRVSVFFLFENSLYNTIIVNISSPTKHNKTGGRFRSSIVVSMGLLVGVLTVDVVMLDVLDDVGISYINFSIA